MANVNEKTMYECDCCKTSHEKKEDAKNCCFLEMQKIRGRICATCSEETNSNVLSTVNVVLDYGGDGFSNLRGTFHTKCFKSLIGNEAFEKLKQYLTSWTEIQKINANQRQKDSKTIPL